MKKISLFLFIPLLCLIIFLGNKFYFRYDLTYDNRYSIHKETRQLLDRLDEDVSVEIYLDGVLPSDLQYLKQSVQDLLDELNANSAKFKIKYRFVNIDEESDENRSGCIKKLRKNRILPTNLQFKKKNKTIEKNIYPVAFFSYKGKECAVLLLKNGSISTIRQMVVNSIDSLEYEVASALDKLLNSFSIKVALLRSHGTPSEKSLFGLIEILKHNYVYEEFYLSGNNLIDTSNYDAIVIVRPTEKFSENQKYILDQYIMQGGKVLFFIDALSIDMASIYENRSFGIPFNTELEDLLFKYGLRINLDLVQDFQCSSYPFIVGNLGNQPQVQLLQWPFAPIITHFPDHVTTKNIDAVYTHFVSSISAVKVENIKQVAIMYTSQYTIRTMAPVFLNIEALRNPPVQAFYREGYMPIACIVEGKFESAYKNELIFPEIANLQKFIGESKENKIFVASTSSIVTNNIDPSGKKNIELGYDPFLKQQFSNREFISNLLKYMVSKDGVINLKIKTQTIRFLDKAKVELYRTQIQVISIIFPIVILVLFGLLWNYFYKRRYVK